MRRGLAIVAVLLACVGLAAGADGADAKPAPSACVVGGPALLQAPANLAGGLRIETQLNIACGRAAGQRFALTGYVEHFRGRRGFCAGLHLPRVTGGGVCKRDDESWDKFCAPVLFCRPMVFPVYASHGPPRSATVFAVVPPGTTRVLVRAGAPGKEVRARALVGQLNGPLLEAFGESEAATFAGTVLPRCFAAPAVRLLAEGSNGEVLARQRGGLSLPHSCAEPEFPPAPEAAGRASLR